MACEACRDFGHAPFIAQEVMFTAISHIHDNDNNYMHTCIGVVISQ